MASDAHSPDAATPRTYADHLRDWERARVTIEEARTLLVPDGYGSVDFTALAVWLYRNGSTLFDAMENLLDATAFKDAPALDRRTEIVQRIGDFHDPS